MSNCDFCGKPILVTPVVVDERTFCSIQCAEEDAEEEAAAEEASNPR
ncbi:MAG: hypothetical protein ACYCW6_22815 [Candidatus Xenobia bacterium]